MNKRLLVGMFSAFMAMAPLCGNAATQSIDAPHLNLTDGCENCHFAGLAPGDCTTNCHKSNAAPYANTVSPVAMTHQGLECQACHNPHVSLQAAGSGISKTCTGVTYDAGTDKSTLAGVAAPDASWAAKTTAERGMIMWVDDGTDNKASFEVNSVNAAAGTVTVKGSVPLTTTAFELRRGQLIAKKVTKVAGKSYIDGDLSVTFPAVGSSPFVDTVNATPTGVCQVCHSAAAGTTHWTSTGGGKDHNPGVVCTTCHKHDSGFLVTACNGCHQGYGLDGVPVSAPGLAQPPTGSLTAGAHQVHAVDYAFPCVTCHVGTGMDRLNAPTNPIADSKIQIGFNWGKYLGYMTNYVGQSGVIYEGTNHTTIATTGTQMTCGTVYCHSDGRAVRLGCATSTDTTKEYAYNATAKTASVSKTSSNTSPKWDGTSADPQGDAVKCNNCHGYQKGTGALNMLVSGQHGFHINYGIGCYQCHAGTTSLVGGNSVIDTPAGRALHANGVYDLKGAGTWANKAVVLNTVAAGKTPLLEGEFDPTSKNCVVTCHSTSRSWKKILDTETCPNVCATVTNADPVILPYAFPMDPINTADVSQAFVYKNDPNTLHFKIQAYDPDNMDVVMNQCRKGSDPAAPTKGGHYNQAGFAIATIADQCSVYTYDPIFPNTPYGQKEITCRFSDTKLAATGGKMCWKYAIADNDPTSYNTLSTNVFVAPPANLTDGLKAPYSAGVNPVDWACINPTLKPSLVIDEPMNNIIPIVTKTVTKSGKRISVTFNVKDPDQVDTEKQAYWATKTGRGGGHSAAQKHYITINWGSEAMTKEQATPATSGAIQFDATGGSKTYYYDFDTYEGTVDTATQLIKTGQPKALGSNKAATKVWIQAYVCDNHMLGADLQMDKDCFDTGWFSVNF